MARPISTPPKERINIKYKPDINSQEEVELPFRLMMIGDYTQSKDETPLKKRKPIEIQNKSDFTKVMKKQNLSLTFDVKNKLESKPDEKNFILTKEYLVHLEKNKKIPDEVIEKLKQVVGKKGNNKEDFFKMIEKEIGKEDAKKYRGYILEIASSEPSILTKVLENHEVGGRLNVKLSFDKLSDFKPDTIAKQVPVLKELLELREALLALRSPLGSMSKFRSEIQGLCSDDQEDLLNKIVNQ